jgi:hypothetical protein
MRYDCLPDTVDVGRRGGDECQDCPSASPRIKRMKEGTAPSCSAHVSHRQLVSLLA